MPKSTRAKQLGSSPKPVTAQNSRTAGSDAAAKLAEEFRSYTLRAPDVGKVFADTVDAARQLGVTQDHIIRLLQQQRLLGVRLGARWLVFRPSLEVYRKTKSSRGRPSSEESAQRARSE
jgi:excisionase family DNA binding protein